MPTKRQENVKRQVRSLLRQGEQKAKLSDETLDGLEHTRFYEAIRYVISHAYVNDDVELQVYFDVHLPDNDPRLKCENRSLKYLQSRNKKTRANAISRVREIVGAEWGISAQLICLHPKTVQCLVAALQSETDVDNAHQLMLILGQIYTRGFWWPQIYYAVEPHFESKEKKLREAAIVVTQHMPFDDRRWAYVMPLLNSCRNKSMLQAFMNHCKRVPESIRLNVLETLLDKYATLKNARRIIVGAICVLVTSKSAISEFDRLVDWSDQEFLDEINFWMQLEPNKLVERLIEKNATA